METQRPVDAVAAEEGATAEVAGAQASARNLREVFDEHAPYVWRSLRWLGVADADLQDVSQEVFLVVHRKLADFEGKSSLRTWLYGICLRVASRWRRSAGRRPEASSEDPPEPSFLPTQEAELDRRRGREQLLRILAGLDEGQRAVFVLYEIEEQPMREVAAAVGCPLQTAYSRLHAARDEVARAWKREAAKEKRR